MTLPGSILVQAILTERPRPNILYIPKYMCGLSNANFTRFNEFHWNVVLLLHFKGLVLINW